MLGISFLEVKGFRCSIDLQTVGSEDGGDGMNNFGRLESHPSVDVRHPHEIRAGKIW